MIGTIRGLLAGSGNYVLSTTTEWGIRPPRRAGVAAVTRADRDVTVGDGPCMLGLSPAESGRALAVPPLEGAMEGAGFRVAESRAFFSSSTSAALSLSFFRSGAEIGMPCRMPPSDPSPEPRCAAAASAPVEGPGQ